MDEETKREKLRMIKSFSPVNSYQIRGYTQEEVLCTDTLDFLNQKMAELSNGEYRIQLHASEKNDVPIDSKNYRNSKVVYLKHLPTQKHLMVETGMNRFPAKLAFDFFRKFSEPFGIDYGQFLPSAEGFLQRYKESYEKYKLMVGRLEGAFPDMTKEEIGSASFAIDWHCTNELNKLKKIKDCNGKLQWHWDTFYNSIEEPYVITSPNATAEIQTAAVSRHDLVDKMNVFCLGNAVLDMKKLRETLKSLEGYEFDNITLYELKEPFEKSVSDLEKGNKAKGDDAVRKVLENYQYNMQHRSFIEVKPSMLDGWDVEIRVESEKPPEQLEHTVKEVMKKTDKKEVEISSSGFEKDGVYGGELGYVFGSHTKKKKIDELI